MMVEYHGISIGSLDELNGMIENIKIMSPEKIEKTVGYYIRTDREMLEDGMEEINIIFTGILMACKISINSIIYKKINKLIDWIETMYKIYILRYGPPPTIKNKPINPIKHIGLKEEIDPTELSENYKNKISDFFEKFKKIVKNLKGTIICKYHGKDRTIQRILTGRRHIDKLGMFENVLWQTDGTNETENIEISFEHLKITLHFDTDTNEKFSEELENLLSILKEFGNVKKEFVNIPIGDILGVESLPFDNYIEYDVSDSVARPIRLANILTDNENNEVNQEFRQPLEIRLPSIHNKRLEEHTEIPVIVREGPVVRNVREIPEIVRDVREIPEVVRDVREGPGVVRDVREDPEIVRDVREGPEVVGHRGCVGSSCLPRWFTRRGGKKRKTKKQTKKPQKTKRKIKNLKNN